MKERELDADYKALTGDLSIRLEPADLEQDPP